MHHIKYPDTEQFRNVIREVSLRSAYVGKDADGNAVYDHSKPKPSIGFHGTVKLHGTNAAVCYNHKDGLWVQSRSSIITPEQDNAGFAKFVGEHRFVFVNIINEIAVDEGIDYSTHSVAIFGEWAGKGIQKGVGISEIDRAFFIFGIKVVPIEESAEDTGYWVSHIDYRVTDAGIYNTKDFRTYLILIDFNNPEAHQNELIKLTEQVEECCPVAKAFGVEGIGEGIVWTAHHEGHTYRFKVKGEKHSSSKVKVLAAVDTEKLESIDKFVEYAVTPSRFAQACENVCPGSIPDNTDIGNLIKWTMGDIIKEESDTLAANNLTPKDISAKVAQAVKKYVNASVS